MLDVSGQFDELELPSAMETAGPCLCVGVSWSWMLRRSWPIPWGRWMAQVGRRHSGLAKCRTLQWRGDLRGNLRIWTGGDVTITAHALALANQAIIRADTFGVAPAGNITLNVGALTGSPISAITSNSWLQDATAGGAGTITIQGIAGSGTPAATVSLDSSLIETGIFGGVLPLHLAPLQSPRKRWP